jgi:hypothetical protein
MDPGLTRFLEGLEEKRTRSSMDIHEERLSFAAPRKGKYEMEIKRSRQRCMAAGGFITSTVSLFAAITYAIICLLTAEFSTLFSVILPATWIAVSAMVIWIFSERFSALDQGICQEYYDKAYEEAKKKLRVVEDSDMSNHCGFVMQQIGSDSHDESAVRGR